MAGYYSIPGYSDLGTSVSAGNLAARSGRINIYFDRSIQSFVPIVSPLDYGARGDGFRDDTSAFQTALATLARIDTSYSGAGIARGGVLWVNPGMRFKIATGLVLTTGVTLAGDVTSYLVPADGFVGNLVSVAAGATDVAIRDLVLDDSANTGLTGGLVAFGTGCERVTVDCRLVGNGHRNFLAASSRLKDVTVGKRRGRIGMKAAGATGGALILTNAAMTSGDNLLTSASALFTSAMTGWTVEVIQAGAADSMLAPGPGYRTLKGFFTYVSATTGRVVDASGVAVNAARDVSGMDAVVAPLDTIAFGNAMSLATAAGGIPIDLDEGTYLTDGFRIGSGSTVEGAGQGVTFVRLTNGSAGIWINAKDRVALRRLTIQGYGPDGGSSGGTFQACVLVQDSTNVTLEDVTVKKSSVGIMVRDQLTDTVNLARIHCEDITTSNGVLNTASATAGIGIWIFNGCTRVHLRDITAKRTDRGPVYFDPGTTTATGATQHGYLDYCSLAGLQASGVCRSGLGAAFGFQGCRYGDFGHIQVDTSGLDADGVTWRAPDGVVGGGDQNGEYSQLNALHDLVLKDMGGTAITLASAVRTRIANVVVDDFNKAQDTATVVYPVVIQSYGGFSGLTNVVAGPDPSFNTIDGLDVIYRGAAANGYKYGVQFTGGTQVPDGNGNTRTTSADGAITVGTPTLTSTSAAFVNAAAPTGDEGRRIVVPGAGAAGADLDTTILDVVNATTATLAVNAGTSVTLKAVQIGYRTAQALGNRVYNHRFVQGASAPSLALANYSGGANCPTEGQYANLVAQQLTVPAASEWLFRIAVTGQDYDRYRMRLDGQQEFGQGSAATDVTLGRLATGVLGLSTGTWSAPWRQLDYSADATLTVAPGVHSLSKTSAGAYTLPAASAFTSGSLLLVTSRTLQAHVLTCASGSFNNGGAATDVATFGGAVGDNLLLAAVSSIWHVVSSKNIAFS